MCDRAVDREVEAVGVVVGMRIAPLAFMTPFVVVVDGVVVRLSIGLRTVDVHVVGEVGRRRGGDVACRTRCACVRTPSLLFTLSVTWSRVSWFPVEADDLGLCDLGENERLVREVADVADAVEVGEVWFSLRADVRDDARRTPR